VIGFLSGTLVVALLAYFLAFLVSQSRIEGGIHSVAEVASGAVLGTIVSAGLFLLIRI
jgi:diacylglycerol kinase (ATP)